MCSEALVVFEFFQVTVGVFFLVLSTWCVVVWIEIVVFRDEGSIRWFMENEES